MIGQIISGATGVLGGLIGGIGSAKANKKAYESAQKSYASASSKNRSAFDRDYYQDIMSRSDVQANMKTMRDNLREMTNRQAATGAITGATAESMAAAKKNNAEVIANTLSGVQAQSQQIKDAAQANYLNRQNALDDQMAQTAYQKYANRAQQWTNLGNQVSGTGNAVGEMFLKK